MKKFAVILFSVMITLSAAACGTGGTPAKSPTVSPDSEASSGTASASQSVSSASTGSSEANSVQNAAPGGEAAVQTAANEAAPMAVHTFLESYDLAGKTVIPFCTSGGSKIDESIPAIKTLCAGATVLEGLTANDSGDVQPWLNKIGMQ